MYSVWFDIKSSYRVTCYCVNLTFIGCNLFVIITLMWYCFGHGHLACLIVIYLTSRWLTKLNYHQMCGSRIFCPWLATNLSCIVWICLLQLPYQHANMKFRAEKLLLDKCVAIFMSTGNFNIHKFSSFIVRL